MTPSPTTIYVALLGEGVAVWRPVHAERLRDDEYRISEQPYDSELEEWEFEPGAVVRCRLVVTSAGEVLGAVGLADDLP